MSLETNTGNGNGSVARFGRRTLAGFAGVLALVFGMATFASAAPPDLTGAKTLHSGSWTKKTNKISGGWSIVEKGGKRYVVLDKKFKTRKAPDLKIILSPTATKDLKNGNAMKKAVVVSLLKSPKGAQSFEIPPRVKLDSYRSIAIHCEKFTKLWGAAPLGSGQSGGR